MTLESQYIENMYWFFYIWEDLWENVNFILYLMITVISAK